MPRPKSYAVFCLKQKAGNHRDNYPHGRTAVRVSHRIPHRPPTIPHFPYTTLFRSLADDRLEAFYDNPNALRDYFRDIGRMVLAAEGRKANDSHADCYQKIVTQRSEERFSRNAETEIVCRLLLETKSGKPSR